MNLLTEPSIEDKEEPFLCVIRLSKSIYKTKRGVSHKLDISLQKRKSSYVGIDWFNTESINDPEVMYEYMDENLQTLPDGLYELNPKYSLTSYEYDEWDLDHIKITPYEEIENET